MHRVRAPAVLLSLLAVVAMACPSVANAQAFLANYDILGPASAPQSAASSAIRLGLARFDSAPQYAGKKFTGAGLSLHAGQNWFAQVGVGNSIQATTGNAATLISSEVMVGGGYRWGDGQALSLQVSKGQGLESRLGLSVSYDWPRYFVRFSFDTGLSPVPADKLRFSAGVRF